MKKNTTGKGCLRYVAVFTLILLAYAVATSAHYLLNGKATTSDQGPSIKGQLCSRSQKTIEDILWDKTGAVFQEWSECDMKEYKNEPNALDYYVIRGWIDYVSFNQNVRTYYRVGFEHLTDTDTYRLAEIETDIMGEMLPEPIVAE